MIQRRLLLSIFISFILVSCTDPFGFLEEKEYCTITFDSQGADLEAYPKQITVERDSFISSLPSEPQKNGYFFSNWVTSLSGGYIFSETNRISHDMTVYAYYQNYGTIGDYEVRILNNVVTILRYIGPEIDDLIIPSSIDGFPVKRIGGSAFMNSNVKTITMPNTITVIEPSAFENCSQLTSIILSENLTSLGSNAFTGCIGLSSIELPEGIEQIYESTFENCSSLISFTFPRNISTIYQSSFKGCSLLESIDIEIEGNLTVWGNDIFENCNNLITLNIAEGVTNIDFVFREIPTLKEFIVAPGNSSYSSIDGVLYNEEVSYLWKYPASKTGEYVIPSTVENIAGYTPFKGCNGITSITINSDIICSVYNNPLNGCTSVSELRFGQDVTYIDSYFKEIPSLVSIIVDSANNSFCSIDEILFSKDETILLRYPPLKSGSIYIIPITVTHISDSGFADNINLSNLEINSGVSEIGNYAFQNSDSLSGLYIPASVTRIKNYAFAGWDSYSVLNFEVSNGQSGWYSLWGTDCYAQMNWNQSP